MIRPLVPFLLTAAAAAATITSADAWAEPPKVLTLEQTAGRGGGRVSFSGRAPAWSWAKDGVHLVRGRGDDAKWIDPTTLEEIDPPPQSADEPQTDSLDELRSALERFEGIDEAKARKLARSAGRARGESRVLADGDRILFHRNGEDVRMLSERGGELLDLSPDRDRLALVRDNDLYVISTADGAERRITEGGGEDHFHGKLDWVYQEEVYGRGNFKGFFWSGDSRWIAFLALDETAVHDFTVIDHIEKDHHRVKPEVSRYPKAGDPNPTVRLGIADVSDGSVRFVDLSEYDKDEPLIVRLEWATHGESDSPRLLFTVQDRIQTWADLNALDPATLEWKTLIHESSDSWVDRPASPRWLANGDFLWESSRTGWNHLYLYSPEGELIRPVTRGEWSVRSVSSVDEERGTIRFSGTRDGAVNRNHYESGLDGRDLRRLTQGDGTHSIDFNADESLFLDSFSSLTVQPEVRLCRANGEVVTVLGQAEIKARDEYLTSEWELLRIPARDGFELDAAILKPVPLDPSRSYPVWLPTYSGPDAPSVRNRWNGSAWYQYLAQHGFIVLQVNVRTASGKGHYAIEQCYKRLGEQELADLEDAVAWVTQHPWADASRVGITGYSYGGFMSAFALTHSDRFALGIAGGGVYDWRLYDTIYTERYMSTPQKNKEGYESTSVLNAAENLNGHLLIHHGVMDDNVHVQNAMQLIYALQRAGKDFDFMLYPQSRHGVSNGELRWHLKQLEWKTMQRELGDQP